MSRTTSTLVPFYLSQRTWRLLLLPLVFGTAACTPQTEGDGGPDPASAGSSGEEPDPSSSGGQPTTDAPTGTAPDTSSSGGSGSTTDSNFCGDGIVDPDEPCDDGPNNSDDAACTSTCKLAACGDGLIWKDVEQCDAGEANADGYGGCSAGCTLNPRCGDGVVDPGAEQCDNGDLNGSEVGLDGAAPCGVTCRWYGRTVFISSELYTGDLGGLTFADYACQTLAESAGLSPADSFRAWISTGFDSPLTRYDLIDLAGAPYILLDGRVVADDFMELIEDGPRSGISITELGEAVHDELVWTNTSPFGEPYSMSGHCVAWTSADKANVARQGYNAIPVELGPAFQVWRSERYWTSFASSECSTSARLYCFQDGIEELAD